MCKQDTESAKVAPESVLSMGNLGGRHLTMFLPGGGLSPHTVRLQRTRATEHATSYAG